MKIAKENIRPFHDPGKGRGILVPLVLREVLIACLLVLFSGCGGEGTVAEILRVQDPINDRDRLFRDSAKLCGP